MYICLVCEAYFGGYYVIVLSFVKWVLFLVNKLFWGVVELGNDTGVPKIWDTLICE